MTDNLPIAPPANLEAERSVLGTLVAFYTPQTVHIVQAAGLKWADFYRQQHRVLYRAVLRLHKDGCHVDPVTVKHLLVTHQSWWPEADGLLEALPSYACPDALKEHARIVAIDARWRRWLDATTTALKHVYDRDETAFWRAVQQIRADVLPGELRVVESPEERAA